MNEEFRTNVETWNAAWKRYDKGERPLSWDPSSKIDSFVNSNGKVSTEEFARFVVQMRICDPSIPTMNFILDRIDVNEKIRETVLALKTEKLEIKG